jgi:hypothetical protein
VQDIENFDKNKLLVAYLLCPLMSLAGSNFKQATIEIGNAP